MNQPEESASSTFPILGRARRDRKSVRDAAREIYTCNILVRHIESFSVENTVYYKRVYTFTRVNIVSVHEYKRR